MTDFGLFRFTVVLILALIAGTFGPTSRVQAQNPARDELLRLVPDDMMFCIVLQDLREQVKRLDKEDSFLAAVKRMPFARSQMQSPEFAKLLDVQKVILSELKITPDQLRDDLLGDAVVFAYRQGKPDQPEQEQAVLLVKARDAKLLATVVERINALQLKTGELKETRPVKHNQRAYIERVKLKDGKPADSEFYFLRDGLLVFSQREAPIRQILERGATTEANYWMKAAANLGITKPLASFLLNPRTFDEEIAQRERAAAVGDRALFREFARYWKAFESVGAYVDVGADLELGIAIHAQSKNLPAAGQRLFAELGKPSALWSVIPQDCLFALSARVDAVLLAETIAGFIEEDRRKAVTQWAVDTLQPFLPDNGSIDSLLKGIGPDWGLWVIPPAADEKNWLPQAIIAVRIPETPEGATAEATARNAAQFLLTAAQLSKENFKVETIKDGKTTIKCLTHPTLFPDGFRPSFTIKEGYVLLASCPEAIRRFEKPKTPATSVGDTPILRVSAKAWREYLKQHKSGIAGFLEKSTGSPSQDVMGVLDTIIANLEPFERLELSLRGDKNRATLVLRIKTAAAK